MSGGTPGPGLSDPTRNPETTRTLLEEQKRSRPKERLRPWEDKASKWLGALCLIAIAGYGLWGLFK